MNPYPLSLTLVGLSLLLGPAQVHAEEPPRPQRYRYGEPHMGTLFQITLIANNEEQAGKAAKAAFNRIAILDGIMSDYRAASELMQLCAKAGGGPVKVSDELFFVLKRAQEIAKLSDGAFDVSVGPLSRLWRQSRRTQQLPTPEVLKEARDRVGWKNIVLDEKAQTVQLLKPKMQLDLGGIAKGYAADEAHKVLKAHGVTQAIVAAGGDVTASDAPPGEDGWVVAIAPIKPGDPAPWFRLKNASISTSGDLNQFAVIDGQRYSHIVDPRTGLGLRGRMSVSVLAPDGITADSLTKVACILGPEKGLPLLQKIPGVQVRDVRALDDELRITQTQKFPQGSTDPLPDSKP
jgi:thiamine biosynthesis lipoprotein